MNRNIKLILEYDGTVFFGFQRQTRHLSIQECLETALAKLLNGPVKITAASGRTDTGVHAVYQVVNFKTKNRMPLRKIHRGLNALLPLSVVVKSISRVRNNFHARYDARSKTYEYRVWNYSIRSPLRHRWTWQVPQKLDISKMRRALRLLKGCHDFNSFCASRSNVGLTRRTLMRALLKQEGKLLLFRFEADGFLYHMVRNLVGTLIEIGKNRLSVKDLELILKARDRKKAGPTAPANGLFLVHVRYS